MHSQNTAAYYGDPTKWQNTPTITSTAGYVLNKQSKPNSRVLLTQFKCQETYYVLTSSNSNIIDGPQMILAQFVPTKFMRLNSDTLGWIAIITRDMGCSQTWFCMSYARFNFRNTRVPQIF